MRKFSILLSSIMVLSLVLTACGGQETTTSIPSTNVPPVTVESTSTVAMSTETATGSDLTTTPGTPGVPVTGENNTSRLTNLLSLGVWNQSNEQVGQVQDFVLDLDKSMISYVVVSTSGFGTAGDKTILIPWDVLQLQSGNANGENAFVLLADPEFLNNAPDVDLTSILPAMGQPAGDWDVDIRNFWDTGTLPGGTGTGAETPTGVATTGADMTATTTTGGTGAGTEASSTATSTGTGTGTGQGTSNGAGLGQRMQGVVLASDVLGATVTIGGGLGQGNGTGQSSTAVPDTTATATTGTGTGTGSATATSTSSGTGTGTGNGSTSAGATQATVEDLIIEPVNGNILYLVVRTSDDDTRWIPVPLGFLSWDATNNGFVLMVNANALQNAPAFQADQFPDTTSAGWDTEFSTFWQSNGGTGTGIGTGGVTASTATATP